RYYHVTGVQTCDLPISWSSSTPPGTFVELAVQVRTGGGWSRWFTYGRWADGGANTGSVPAQRDEHAVLDVDLLRVLNGTADAVRFRLHLGRTGAGPLSDRKSTRLNSSHVK